MTGEFIDDKDSTVSAIIPIDYVEVQLTQRELFNFFPNWQPGGPFDTSFSDLAQEAKEKRLEALQLEELKRIVSEDAAKGSEVLELFGFKFPIGNVSLWSTVLLWCIQLYFLVYLKQLSGKLGPTDKGWDVPWIAMDQSPLARSLLLVTITFLPCMSLAFLGVRTFRQLNWFAVVNGLGFIELSDFWGLVLEVPPPTKCSYLRRVSRGRFIRIGGANLKAPRQLTP